MGILHGVSEIQKGQRALEMRLTEALPTKVPQCWAGYQGGRIPITAYWSDHLGFWFATRALGEEAFPRYWNAFGIDRPSRGGDMSITCEINLPFDGISRQVQGALLQDERGRVVLVHRGKIGGGRPGVGRKSFFRQYRGPTVAARDGDVDIEVATLGPIDSPDFPSKVAEFVREVDRIKRLVVGR